MSGQIARRTEGVKLVRSGGATSVGMVCNRTRPTRYLPAWLPRRYTVPEPCYWHARATATTPHQNHMFLAPGHSGIEQIR